MKGKLGFALLLAALSTTAQAEIHTRSSFTITIGNRPAPPPRVVVVEREAPPQVVYVDRYAPRCHKPKVVYVEPRRHCAPAKVVVLRGRDRGRRYDHGGPWLESREVELDDRLAMDQGPRSIHR